MRNTSLALQCKHFVLLLVQFCAVAFCLHLDFFFFFFNDTATTEIYTLSLHDALPIRGVPSFEPSSTISQRAGNSDWRADRKSTRLNSSHDQISYAVFCWKKKTKTKRKKKRKTKTKKTKQRIKEKQKN